MPIFIIHDRLGLDTGDLELGVSELNPGLNVIRHTIEIANILAQRCEFDTWEQLYAASKNQHIIQMTERVVAEGIVSHPNLAILLPTIALIFADPLNRDNYVGQYKGFMDIQDDSNTLSSSLHAMLIKSLEVSDQ